MAKRRMFSLDVVDTDKFLEMPASTQALYFHLGMRADDDGFVSSPKKIVAIANCSADDLRLLISKSYVIPFESGVCVITDWKKNNFIRPDRYIPTEYQREKNILISGNTGYGMSSGIPSDIPTVYPDKVSIGKDSIDKGSIEDSNKIKDYSTTKRKKEGVGSSPPVSPPTALSIFNSFEFEPSLKEAVKEWLSYKHEKRQDYKATGLKTLLGQIKKAQDNYGAETVAEVIRDSMASNYSGITLDRLAKNNRQPKPDRLDWIDKVVLE